ncbi:hypothetical protein QOT17_025344 [Balamuthia mandrillaris]
MESKAGLEELPKEVLAMIFGFVPTKQLYPSCFLLSSTCLAAVLDAMAWRARCEEDLGVRELPPGKSSWFHTYRDSRLVWDQEQLRKTVECQSWVPACGIFSPTPDLIVWPRHTGNLRHYVTVRSKQTFSTGIVALEFIIEQCNSSTWSVGFVDDNFDFDHRRFIDHKREVCYSWCNLVSASHSVTGSPTTFSKSRRLLSGWQQGDVLGALVDFDKREIQYFRNDKWNETVKLRPESTKLWAITTMFNSGNAVRIRLRSLGSRPAEWREQHHHA